MDIHEKRKADLLISVHTVNPLSSPPGGLIYFKDLLGGGGYLI